MEENLRIIAEAFRELSYSEQETVIQFALNLQKPKSNYPKLFMSVSELEEQGLSGTWLRNIYNTSGQKVVFKLDASKGGGKLIVNTAELEKYIQKERVKDEYRRGL